MNTCVHDILSINRQALRGLHQYAGFDFEKPFGIERIDGKFTVNAILKKISNPHNCKIVLLIKDLHWNDNNRLCTVLIHSNGTVTTDLSKPPRWYDYSFETFCRKGDFEITRKKDNSLAFLVWQSRELLNPPKPEKRNMLARFDLIETKVYYKNTQDKTAYIGHLTLKEHGLNRNACDFEYSSDRVFYRYSAATFSDGYTSVSELIDHSGYLIVERRNEFKRKAASIIAERKKNEYVAMDNAGQIAELHSLIEKRKAEIMQALTDASDYEAYKAVSESLSVFHGLADIVGMYERFCDASANKRYESIEHSNRVYNVIKEKLTA